MVCARTAFDSQLLLHVNGNYICVKHDLKTNKIPLEN